MIKTHQIKIHPNKTMLKVINDLFDYRRYCWNEALATWNAMYDESVILEDKTLRPNEYYVVTVAIVKPTRAMEVSTPYVVIASTDSTRHIGVMNVV